MSLLRLVATLFHSPGALSNSLKCQRHRTPIPLFTNCYQFDFEIRFFSTAPFSESPNSDIIQSDRPKQKARNKYHMKLHNRVLSPEELLKEEEFRNSCAPDEDSFGALEPKYTKLKYNTKRSECAASGNEQYRGVHPTKTRQFDSNQHSVNSISAKQNNSHPKRIQRMRSVHHGDDLWSDSFGTLQQDSLEERARESLYSEVGSHEERFIDDADEEESNYIRLSAFNRRRSPEWYGRKILKLGNRGEIRRAIEVFEDWMLKKDRVKPNSYVFTCLITVLGRAGYTSKAFSFFNQMKKMGLEPKPATYTGLFNACSNSPWKEDGRTRADNLLRLMREKEVEPNHITGKAMVKAFSVCGSVQQAFSLMDQMSRVYRPDRQCFSFLLMGCISDRQAGLRHAIQVWRVMLDLGITPNLPLYNLLIRCVRDCGVGDTRTFLAFLTGSDNPDPNTSASHQPSQDSGSRETTPAYSPTETERHSEDASSSSLHCEDASTSSVHSENSTFSSVHSEDSSFSSVHSEGSSISSTHSQCSKNSTPSSEDIKNCTAEQEDSSNTNSQPTTLERKRSSSVMETDSVPIIPDLLSPASDVSGLVSLGDLSSRESRLALLGGVDGILGRMRKDRAKPNVITFTQLISVAPPTMEAEEQLLAAMRYRRVKPDTDLVNTLIHKRCMRQQFEDARAAKSLLDQYKLTANQRTFGVLALTCKKRQQAVELLEEMQAADMAPNMEILDTLMNTAQTNYRYKLWVLRQCQKLDMLPNAKFLHSVEKGIAYVRKKIVEAEHKEDWDNYFTSDSFRQSLQTFVAQYEAWLATTSVQKPAHPWAPFKPIPVEEKTSAAVS